MSITLQGIGIGGGIAIGQAHLISHADIEIAHYQLTDADIPAELARFDDAIRVTRKSLEMLWGSIPENAPAELGAFLSLHIMLLNDHMLSKEPRNLIEQQHCNAEWALKLQLEVLLAQFDEIEDEYLRERRSDVIQVVERVFKTLAGHENHSHALAEIAPDCILVAHDLSPADMVLFKDTAYLAFITDVGGPTSHTAILARSLDLPSVLALRHARELIREDELIIVDGINGVVIIDPDEIILKEYRHLQADWLKKQQALQDIRTSRPVTKDGEEIELFANIEVPDDCILSIENGATGVGLFRSEFLFLSESDLPTEEEQFLAYKQVAEAMKGQPVIIRTVDLGKDKIPKWQQERETPNPALGLTGIRLCMAEPQMFRTQLRALLRASAYGKIKLLLPMLSYVGEVRQTRKHLEEAKAQLREDHIAFDENIELGGMIEVPAAAVQVAQFLAHLDFISIGTNDLIQYTLAVDRNDDSVSHLYDPLHPAVIQLLHHVISTANRLGKPVSMCGEMAGDPALTRLLLGLGLRRFSMLPIQLLKVKQEILTGQMQKIKPLVEKMLVAEDSQCLRELLQQLHQDD
ncbi:phosphoenolpyruvate--protein phosphotransferase [Iodobacter fluviatilis]|uniref:Phosphoenolpyruvate-protein phosphotransferase n=1 Tax=Iodobacter fluviatilis TaxID=537 RepID=A0A377STS0_9NEIS|nr:phosphoenolpyruvate--protein phosphotransferase [Iodobacter fluviatilis]TCU87921.1 phosphoenolpyruvate--protein phosphotransferase [Iodobacter fluviatilis]STR45422.1 Phosphoenolpyruvate-protein phosphotransferase [Iodobacter fluviatilis]